MPSSTQQCTTQHASVAIAITKHPLFSEKYIFQSYLNILFLKTSREMKNEIILIFKYI